MLVYKLVVLHHCSLALLLNEELKDLYQCVFSASTILVNLGILKWLSFLLGFKDYFERKERN